MRSAVDAFGRETRHAAPRLLRSPAFSAAAVLTLALAIGANVAIFAVVHRVLLNPLPYGDSGRLVAIDHAMPTRNILTGVGLTSQLYFEYLERARTLDGLALYRTDELTLTGDGDPERVRIARATPSLVAVLRVGAQSGRWFTDDEGVPGAQAVAVLSHGLWTRRYGRDPSIVGRVVALDSVATRIVGVMPASFAFPDPRVDVWVPESLSRSMADNGYSYQRVGRLRANATLAAARSELTRVAVELESRARGNGYAFLVSNATTLIDATIGVVSRALWILLTAVGLVLLIACANVANLFLVRSDAKQREVAVRRALGAGRSSIAAYFLAESMWLAAAGGLLGIALGWAALDLLIAFGPANLPRLHEVRLDPTVLAFAAILSVAGGVAFGSIPLLRIGALHSALGRCGRSTTTNREGHRARHLLMAGQMALALVLLVASGLMLRSFVKLRGVDTGFDASSALTFRIGLPRTDYPDRGALARAHRAMLDRLSAAPGVKAVSAATCLPLADQGCMAGPIFVEGRALDSGVHPLARFLAVADGYFDTMGTRIVRGRGIDRRDLERNDPVAVVDEALARSAFAGEDPIGHRIRIGSPAVQRTPRWLTIVGVAANTAYRALGEAAPVPKLYMPFLAASDLTPAPRLDAVSYVVRTTVRPESVTAHARAAIAAVDSRVALAQLRTLEDIVDRAASQTAFTMALLLVAAVVALLLGVVGIYGAMSYIVSQRTSEIGVRMALGATPGSVAAMIVRQGAFVTLSGAAVGLIGALAEGRLMQSLLYGVQPRDPGVLAVTTAILIVVAIVACWLPARRAARLSPTDALRTE